MNGKDGKNRVRNFKKYRDCPLWNKEIKKDDKDSQGNGRRKAKRDI